jgi:primary-amine oxidase
MSLFPHPLSDLSTEESNLARDAVLRLHPGTVIDFRTIYLQEPNKEDVLRFLEVEHAGKVTTTTPRPARLAQVKYDVIGGSEPTQYHESSINLVTAERIKHTIVGQEHQANLSMYVKLIIKAS